MFWLGILLLCWVAWDLFTGKAWLHREFSRQYEPAAYWGTTILWLLVAISCFYW